jgi:ribosomal-protein-alanine N-acetyltransferase
VTGDWKYIFYTSHYSPFTSYYFYKVKMKLRILQQNESKQDPLFQSEDCQTVLTIYDDYYPQIGFIVPWVAYLVIRDNQVVGLCSFTGQPNAGKVEIAYWTFKDFEGQGIATFACKELVKIAQNTDPNVIITAKTAPEQNASTKILTKNGFVFKEIVQDEEIGDAWLWTL